MARAPEQRHFASAIALVGVLAALLGVAIVFGGAPIIVAIGIGLPLLVVCWCQPGLGVAVLMILVFFVDWLTEEAALLPHGFTWAIEALIAVMALRAVARTRKNRES